LLQRIYEIIMDGESIVNHLQKRDRCWVDRYGQRYCESGWYYYGRWILAGVALLIFLLVLLSCCCLARRRRKRGTKPVYGTGWMAPPPKYGAHQNDHQLNNAEQGWGQNQGQWAQPPPPAYGQPHPPQNSGTAYAPNDGYYGNQNYPQQNDLQSPPNAYQPENHAYPPAPNYK
jgi:hypothetical protein